MYLDSVWRKRKQNIKDIFWLDVNDEFLEKIWQMAWSNHMRKKKLPYVKQQISTDINRPTPLVILLHTLFRLVSLHIVYWCTNILNMEVSYGLSENVLIERTETNNLFAKTPNFYSKVTKVVPMSTRECFKLNKFKQGKIKLVPAITNFSLLRKYIALAFVTKNSFSSMSYMYPDLLLQSYKFECGKIAFSRLLEGSKVVNVFLENDYGVPHTAISAVCRDRNIRTLHIAHGVFFDTNLEYMPVSTDVLISVLKTHTYAGTLKYKPIPVVPLQLLPLADSSKSGSTEYSIGIFAKAGVLWHTELIYNNIENVNWKQLLGEDKVLLRHHPKASASVRRSLEQLIPSDNVELSDAASIGFDILRCDIVVTFSMDSLIPLMYANKRVIYVVENERLKKYKYLRDSFKNLSIVYNRESFEIEFKRLKTIDVVKSKDNLRDVFGEYRLDKIDNILSKLCST